jgi:hypothetical protein
MDKCTCYLCSVLGRQTPHLLDDYDYGDYETDYQGRYPAPSKPIHKHKPKEYVGFTEKFMYCEDCGKKLEE